MGTITKEELVKHAISTIVKPIGLIQLLSIIGMIASPVLLLWFDWYFAGKIALTCLCVLIVCGVVYIFIKRIAEDIIEEDPELREFIGKERKSFQERVEEKMGKK